MPVQMSLDEEELALLDEWKRQHTNNNRTRLVEDLVRLAEEATAATDKDDPREALHELIEDYDGYARDADYDPDESGVQLDSDRLREMCLYDPVPPINPRHVIPPEIEKMKTWTKAGIIAGMLRYKYDDPLVKEVKQDNNKSVKDLIRRYCGGRSSVDREDVLYRLDTSVPEVEKIDVDVEEWMSTAESMTKPETDVASSALEPMVSRGEELMRALREDGDDRLDEVKELKGELVEEQSKMVAGAEPADE